MTCAAKQMRPNAASVLPSLCCPGQSMKREFPYGKELLMRILIAEDDRSIAKAVRRRLEAECHAVDVCDNGRDAYEQLRMAPYDLAIMDIMMPIEDGLSAVRRAREAGITVPVLFLTARDAVADRVKGLDAGGDDYLVKPFALEELMARVRALTRRAGFAPAATNELVYADLTVNLAGHTVTRANRPIPLTGREYALLEILMRNREIVLTRLQIEQNLFNFDYDGASNMVDVYIRYLRKKIDDGFDTKLIHTVRGTGYVLRNEG